MAERRMISKRISLSEKFADLKSDRARMLYLMLLPHCDDYGLFDASPRTCKAQVAPLLRITPKAIEEALEDMERVGLVRLYEEGGHVYGQIVGFDRFQTLKSDRRPWVACPLPPWMVSDGFQPEQNGNHSVPNGTYKLREEKLREESHIESESIVVRGVGANTGDSLLLEDAQLVEDHQFPPSVRFIRDIQIFTGRPPCTSSKMGTPDYRATMQAIDGLVARHGYDLVLAAAREVHAQDGTWSVFAFEWKIRDMLSRELVPVWDAGGEEIVELWNQETWKGRHKEVVRKEGKICLRA